MIPGKVRGAEELCSDVPRPASAVSLMADCNAHHLVSLWDMLQPYAFIYSQWAYELCLLEEHLWKRRVMDGDATPVERPKEDPALRAAAVSARLQQLSEVAAPLGLDAAVV